MNATETTSVQENSTNTKGLDISPRSILTASVFSAVAITLQMLVWIITTLLTWSTDDLIEDNLAFYIAVLPVLVSPLLIILMRKLGRTLVFQKIMGNGLALLFLGVQGIIDWLIYAKFHGLSPFSPTLVTDGMPLSTGWLATDNEPIILFAIWTNWNLLGVIPALLGWLSGMNRGGTGTKSGMHLGLAIIGTWMAFRSGGPWSAPVHNIALIIVLIPVMAMSWNRTSNPSHNHEAVYHSRFPTIGIFTLIGFWLALPTFQSNTRLSTSWTWLAFTITNVSLLYIIGKAPEWEKARMGKKILACTWMVLIAATFFMILVNLNSLFAIALPLWQILGFIGMSFFPELLLLKERHGSTRVGSRVFFTCFFFILGVVLAYVMNLYDPISSYAALVIMGIPMIMSLFSFTKSRRWPGEKRDK